MIKKHPLTSAVSRIEAPPIDLDKPFSNSVIRSQGLQKKTLKSSDMIMSLVDHKEIKERFDEAANKIMGSRSKPVSVSPNKRSKSSQITLSLRKLKARAEMAIVR